MPLSYPKKEEKNENEKGKKPSIQWTLSDPRYQIEDMVLQADTLREIEDVISYVQNKKNFLTIGDSAKNIKTAMFLELIYTDLQAQGKRWPLMP